MSEYPLSADHHDLTLFPFYTASGLHSAVCLSSLRYSANDLGPDPLHATVSFLDGKDWILH